ncbi:unnamed protein product [Calypogeia fissa]
MEHDTNFEDPESNGVSQEVTILVVGGLSRDADDRLVNSDASRCKARVANGLAEGRGVPHLWTSEAGVRIFSRDWSAAPEVVDTTPMVIENDQDFVQNARSWVSLNSLKRLVGKLIFVVCVVMSSGPNDPLHKEPDFPSKQFTWLHLLSYIFNGHQLSMMMLVKIIGTDHSGVIKSGVRDVLQRGGFARSNISFEAFEEETLPATVTSALGHSRFHGTSRNNLNTMVPFHLSAVTSISKEVDAYGPWALERVILFGLIGSGKSTCAQMLTSGRLDTHPQRFPSGPGLHPITSNLQRGEGRGWYVVDTPGMVQIAGLFQADRNFEADTVGASTTRLAKTIRAFAREAKRIYTHFIYVWKGGRMLFDDERFWTIFLKFSQRLDVKSSLTVIIPYADADWIRANIHDLWHCFQGCESFCSVDFAPVKIDDDVWEQELQCSRIESLIKLEDHLSCLSAGRPLGSSESLSKEDSRLRKVNNLLMKAAMNSLKSSHGLHASAAGQKNGNALRRSSRWRPSHRYM